MGEVRRVVRRAGWRLLLIDFFRVLAVALTVGLALAILTRIVERVFGLSSVIGPWWAKGAMYAGGAVLLATIIATVARKKRTIAVAQELDERAGLKEALSTSLYIERETDPWSRNVVQEAQRVANGVRVSKAIPFEAPRLWPVPVCTGMALALVWFGVPNLDLFGKDAKKVAEVKKQQEVQQVRAEIESKSDKLKEMLAKAKVQFAEEPAEAAEQDQKPEMTDPDAMRRAAVKKLTNLAEKLEAEKEGDKAEQMQAMKEAMRQLKQPGQGPLNEFTRQLSRGDFNKAQEMLKQFEMQMADQSMSPEAREQAKKQMENLAKQLEQLAKNQEQLQKKLENAGLDKKTAQELAKKASSGDPKDLKDALEKAQNLSEEQKKQMMEMAKAAMECQGMCENMSQAMSKAAQGMTQEGLQQEGMQGLEQLASELSDAEMMQADMENLDASLEEAKKQLSELAGQCMGGDCEGEGMGQGKTGSFREGNSNKFGQGSGGPGKGNGASPESEAVDYEIEKTKANVKTGQGPIIGSRLVYGDQVKGESRAEFAAAVEAGKAEVAEAIDGQTIPREYHDAVKTYFGRLQEKVKKDKGDAPAAPAPAPAPAAAPK